MSDGQYCDLDAWKVKITVPSRELIDELPVSLSKPDGLEAVVEGIAWNYVSIGMDAEAAYRFHHIRETKPYLASTRMLNQMWYGLCGCRAGWFCCPRALNNKVKLEILTADNKYEEVKFPNSVKAMVLVNLQSYAGGRNIFGKKLTRRDIDKGMKDPAFNDGMIEVIGLKHGIHTGFVLTGMAHGERIAQCRGARLEIKAPKSADGEPGRSFMQLDGEPWPQKIPSGEKEDPLVMEMTLDSKSRLLMNLDGKPMERPEGASKL